MFVGSPASRTHH